MRKAPLKVKVTDVTRWRLTEASIQLMQAHVSSLVFEAKALGLGQTLLIILLFWILSFFVHGRLLMAWIVAVKQQTPRKACSECFGYYPQSSVTILLKFQQSFIHIPIVLNKEVERLWTSLNIRDPALPRPSLYTNANLPKKMYA